MPPEGSSVPGLFSRFFSGIGVKWKLGFGRARFAHTPLIPYHLLGSFYRLVKKSQFCCEFSAKVFLYAPLLILLSSLLGYLVLQGCPYADIDNLKALIASGLLIAPLVNMVNAGHENIIAIYLRVFGATSGEGSSLEPRFKSLKEDLSFIRELVYFGSHKEERDTYIKLIEDTISFSIKVRKDMGFKGSLSTISVGMLIMLGYMFLLMGIVWLSLIVLLLIYSHLIIRQFGAFRTSLKQLLLENLIVSVRTYYETTTPSGTDFLSQYSE